MSQPKGSVGVAVTIAVIIVIAVTSVGYYQFVYCSPTSCQTNATSTTTAAAGCAPPSCVTIEINPGAATLTTTAFSPDVATLMMGVNNTFQFHNNDSQSGGVAHTATAKTCPKTCPFDTGVIAYNVTSATYTITAPGTYPYYCQIHPSTMIGTIVVVAGSGASKGGSSGSSTTSGSAGSSLSSSSSAASSGSSGTSSSQSSAAPKGVTVSIPSGAGNWPTSAPGFAPANVTVVLGVNSSVTWTNNDTAVHTVYSTSIPTGATAFQSPLIAAGGTFTETFTVAGTYEYHCSLHSWMTGSVIVKNG